MSGYNSHQFVEGELTPLAIVYVETNLQECYVCQAPERVVYYWPDERPRCGCPPNPMCHYLMYYIHILDTSKSPQEAIYRIKRKMINCLRDDFDAVAIFNNAEINEVTYSIYNGMDDPNIVRHEHLLPIPIKNRYDVFLKPFNGTGRAAQKYYLEEAFNICKRLIEPTRGVAANEEEKKSNPHVERRRKKN